jgi:octaprenyl-diphosphate synthase
MIDRDSAFEEGLTAATAWATTHPAAHALQNRMQDLLGEDLEHVERKLRSSTRSRYAEVNRLSQSAAASGGKRLRPQLVFLSARAISVASLTADQHSDLVSIASAVELVHAASLVHDDVMDAAVERRHQPTIVHRTGNATAVLLGDFLFTRGYALAASCRQTFAARQISRAATQLCEGELRQQQSAGEWSTTLAEYRGMLIQKTGALCAVSCQLGGWRAGADRSQAAALKAFGSLLGLAFQVYDDWLDYWGTDKVGKTLGTDLIQLKPTLPLIRLLSTSTPSRRAELEGLLAEGVSGHIDAIRQQLADSDAEEFTLRIARRCAEQAQQRLSVLPNSVAKECLQGLADYSVNRTA